MDRKYRTVLEEGDRYFSSRQKQKLGLVRLFLRKDVSLYLLDEVTLVPDGDVEKQIAEYLERVAKNAIVISVSHKEELLRRSKCIFVLYEGKIMATGIQEDLMKESELHQNLYLKE